MHFLASIAYSPLMMQPSIFQIGREESYHPESKKKRIPYSGHINAFYCNKQTTLQQHFHHERGKPTQIGKTGLFSYGNFHCNAKTTNNKNLFLFRQHLHNILIFFGRKPLPLKELHSKFICIVFVHVFLALFFFF